MHRWPHGYQPLNAFGHRFSSDGHLAIGEAGIGGYPENFGAVSGNDAAAIGAVVVRHHFV